MTFNAVSKVNQLRVCTNSHASISHAKVMPSILQLNLLVAMQMWRIKNCTLDATVKTINKLKFKYTCEPELVYGYSSLQCVVFGKN